MSAKDHTRTCLLVLGLLCIAACASVGSVPTATPRRLTRLNVVVSNWDARVEALLVDQYGRRSGWTREGVLEEVNGCISQSGWEDGIPNPRPDESDTAAVAEWERMQVEDSTYAATTPPLYHHFSIGNDRNYRDELAKRFVGLIDQGSCELGLVPLHPGALSLTINAEGVGVRGCEDTTSTTVALGKPQRWRLSWKLVGDSCIVKTTRLDARGSTK